jgi:hypothetical protein
MTAPASGTGRRRVEIGGDPPGTSDDARLADLVVADGHAHAAKTNHRGTETQSETSPRFLSVPILPRRMSRAERARSADDKRAASSSARAPQSPRMPEVSA